MYAGLPEDVRQYRVYNYEHIDNGEFLDPKQVIESISNRQDADKLIAAIKDLFLKAGWEGDGNIKLIWVPPFLGSGFGGESGFYLWYVKQSNNGTSWIASPTLLPLDDEQLDLIK